MSASTRIGLPYLSPLQAQKHVTVNESLRKLDALVQLSAKSKSTSAEPGAPADGDCYILPAGKTGAAWGAMANLAIAYYVDGAWTQLTPRAGWVAYLEDEGSLHSFDGAAWNPVGAAAATGAIGDNLLINGDFQINQRNFVGGALAAGAYGFDRWKAAAGGANCTLSGVTLTLASGELEQVVEPSVFGAASFASLEVSVSVEAPSADLVVAFGSQSAAIAAGSGRRSASLSLGAGDSGNLSFRIKKATGSGVSFARVKLELGATATAWRAPSRADALALCHRYYRKTGGQISLFFYPTVAAGYFFNSLLLPQPMRAAPACSRTVVAYGNIFNNDPVNVAVAGQSAEIIRLSIRSNATGESYATIDALVFDAEL